MHPSINTHWAAQRWNFAQAHVSIRRQGLVKVGVASKTLTLLTSRVDDADARAPGTTIDYANDPDIAPDGKVYFSDSAHGVFPVRNRFGYFDTMQAYMLAMFQARRARALLPRRLASTAAVNAWLLCLSQTRRLRSIIIFLTR